MSTGSRRRHGNHTHLNEDRAMGESDWSAAAHKRLRHTLR